MHAQFDHERLKVYQKSRDLNPEVHRIIARLPRGTADEADQLKRGANSIRNNAAEGAGEFAAKEKAGFYRFARRSATECAAILDGLVDYQLIDEQEIVFAKALLAEIVPLLVTMARNLERRGAR